MVIMEGVTDILLLMRRLFKLHERNLEKIRTKYRLSLLEIKIISFLYNNPGKDTVGHISQLRMIPKGNVSQGVDSLIQRSLLRRAQDKQDRRRIHLTLTDASLPIVEDIRTANEAFCRQIFSGFSKEELAQFSQLNQRLMQNLIQGLEGK